MPSILTTKTLKVSFIQRFGPNADWAPISADVVKIQSTGNSVSTSTRTSIESGAESNRVHCSKTQLDVKPILTGLSWGANSTLVGLYCVDLNDGWRRRTQAQAAKKAEIVRGKQPKKKWHSDSEDEVILSDSEKEDRPKEDPPKKPVMTKSQLKRARKNRHKTKQKKTNNEDPIDKNSTQSPSDQSNH